MARDNEERFGAPNIDAPPPPPVIQPESSASDQPFSFVAPTEFVELPSRGRFYPEDHPLYNQDSIEIRYMTAKDEDILISTALLKKGIALDRLMQSVIVNKQIKPDHLLVGDKNALLVAIRASGYGELYEAKVTCPACLTTSDYEFNLAELNVNYGDNLEEYGAELSPDNVFTITLPKTKIKVGMKLMTGADEKSLATLAQRRKKNNLPESTLTDQFRMIIASVNGSMEQAHIDELIDCMPASDSKYLRNIYTKIIPNIDLKQEFECPACTMEEEVIIPFTTEFFWPK